MLVKRTLTFPAIIVPLAFVYVLINYQVTVLLEYVCQCFFYLTFQCWVFVPFLANKISDFKLMFVCL